MNGFRLKRRQVIGIVGISAGALALYTAGLNLSGIVSALADTARPPSRLDELLASPWWSATIGKRYLASLKGEPPDGESLRTQIARDLSATGAEDLAEQARLAIAANFERSEVCELDGWTLSVTECRMGALAFLAGIESTRPLEHQQTEILKLENWGPRSVSAGEPFNEQPNGNSALWLRFSSLERGNYLIRFGDYDMITSVHPDRNVITSDLTPAQSIEATSLGGKIPVTLVDRSSGRQQLLGMFEVKGQLTSEELARRSRELRILGWGPRRTRIGQGFNHQPDGSSAFWVQTGGSHRKDGNYVLMLGDIPMRTTVREKLITASLPPDIVSDLVGVAGALTLVLVDNDLEKQHEIGKFLVIRENHVRN